MSDTDAGHVAQTDVGDEDQVAADAFNYKIKRERDAEHMQEVMGTYAGRALVWRMLEQCGVFRTAPTGPELVRFEGGRDIGLWLIRECFTVAEHLYSLMQKEAVLRQKKEDEDG